MIGASGGATQAAWRHSELPRLALRQFLLAQSDGICDHVSLLAFCQPLRRSISLLALLVGVLAGIGAICFTSLCGVVTHFLLRGLAHYPAVGPRGELEPFAQPELGPLNAWWFCILPALGCIASAWLSSRFAPEAAGHGTDAAIFSYHHKNGSMRARVPLLKALCSAITLGTGGSAGREGPIAQIGAGCGATIARWFGLPPKQARILLAAGMAGGVGAIFRAPFAGALFAAEILYRDAELESEVVMPGFLSSAAAYSVYCGWHGEFGSLFDLAPGHQFSHLSELVPYTLLAFALVLGILCFTRVFAAGEGLVARLRWPRSLIAAAGGLLCGSLAYGAYLLLGDAQALCVAGSGYGVLQAALDGELLGMAGVRVLLVVAMLKVITTTCTIAGGGSGGIFGPSMIIGGCVGGAVGLLGKELGWVEQPSAFAIVGMCGFFAGGAKTPISTIVMVTEMTGSYHLLLPAMWVCGLTFLLSRRVALYRSQVQNRAASPAHAGEYQVALLESMTVADVWEPGDLRPVAANAPLGQIVQLLMESKEEYFHVVDADGRLVGVFSATDVRGYSFNRDLYHVTIASDLMTQNPVTVSPADDLHRALEKFDSVRLDELPVVDAADPTHLLGRLRRRAINRAYTQRLRALREKQQ